MLQDKVDKSAPLVLDDCGGRDFLSYPIQITSDGQYIFCCEECRVTMFNAQSGLPVKTLKTGPMLSMRLLDTPGELVVAGRKRVTLWNYEQAKVVTKHKYFKKEMHNKFCYESVLGAYIPKNFTTSGDVYLTVIDKKTSNMNNMLRVSVTEVTTNQIFKNITVGSEHIGDNNNTIAVIANHSIHGFKNSTVLCYDRNLAVIQGYNTDKERPLTIVRCHPTEKTLACGDTSGRILIFTGVGNRDVLKAAKSILHWHTLPLTSLSWSLEGQHLFSGGGERVLCKWFPENNLKPTFLPRMNANIVGLDVSETATAVRLENNTVLVLDRQDRPCNELVGLCRNISGWSAGLAWDNRSKCLMLNGNVGHIQVFHPESKDTHSIDITQQNFLTDEREKHPYNAEVDKLAVSSCGLFLATMDCCWTPVHRLNLKFWHFDLATQKFVLNTQVDTPHLNGIKSLAFQSTHTGDPPMLLSVGNDKQAKVWVFRSSAWECKYSLEFRGLDCVGGTWSSDGSVLALAFAHIVTLWDKEARLRTTLTVKENTEDVTCLEFGKGLKHGSFLYTSSDSLLCVWDLLTLKRTWSLPLEAESLNLVSDSATGNLAVIAKDTILILDPMNHVEFARFNDHKATGGAVFATRRQASVLFFLTYNGLIKTIGPKYRRKVGNAAQFSVKPKTNLFGSQKSSVTPMEISPEIYQTTPDDVGALLAVPLHAVSSCSALASAFIGNRLRALPKTQVLPVSAEEKIQSEKSNEEKKIRQVFSKKAKDVTMDLDSYRKLFKKTKKL